jgi:cytoskeletal protein CcmA (bactofilin family)
MSFFGNRRQAESTAENAVQKPELPTHAGSPPPSVGFETVLGANSSLEGTLRSSANIRLDGTFTGTLEITGNVLVGETAKIKADINARNISIAGAVRGNISGKKVQLLRTGRVWGDIQAVALTTEEGAFIDGKITMSPRETDEKPGAPETTQSQPQTTTPGMAQPPDYDRTVDGVTPVGLGAIEEDTDAMFHDAPEPPSDYPGNPLIDNISADDPEVFARQTDSEEGQAYSETDDGNDDEVKQST